MQKYFFRLSLRLHQPPGVSSQKISPTQTIEVFISSIQYISHSAYVFCCTSSLCSAAAATLVLKNPSEAAPSKVQTVSMHDDFAEEPSLEGQMNERHTPCVVLLLLSVCLCIVRLISWNYSLTGLSLLIRSASSARDTDPTIKLPTHGPNAPTAALPKTIAEFQQIENPLPAPQAQATSPDPIAAHAVSPTREERNSLLIMKYVEDIKAYINTSQIAAQDPHWDVKKQRIFAILDKVSLQRHTESALRAIQHCQMIFNAKTAGGTDLSSFRAFHVRSHIYRHPEKLEEFINDGMDIFFKVNGTVAPVATSPPDPLDDWDRVNKPCHWITELYVYFK
jgi:hypothetical protein